MVTRAPCWVGVGGLQTLGASRAELQSTEASPKPALLTAPRVFLSAPTATEFRESVRTLRPPAPWLAHPAAGRPLPVTLATAGWGRDLRGKA